MQLPAAVGVLLMVPVLLLGTVVLAAAGEQTVPGARTVLVLETAGKNVGAGQQLPPASRLADEIALQLSGQELAVRLVSWPGPASTTDSLAQLAARARQQRVLAVVWADLAPSGANCPAAGMIRLNILVPDKAKPWQRQFCPADLPVADLVRAMAVAVAGSLRKQLRLPEPAAEANYLTSLLPQPRARPGDKPAAAAGAAGTPCPEPAPPEPCPASPPPVEPARGRWRLAAGFYFSSHPSFASAGYGTELELGMGWGGRLELGLGLAATPARSVTALEVSALYQAWPTALWARLLLGSGELQWLLDGGVALARVSLRALLQRLEESIVVERWDPVLRLRAGARWWLTHSVALQLLAGSAIYLRTQRFTYFYLGLPLEVLALDRVALECQLGLLLAFGS